MTATALIIPSAVDEVLRSNASSPLAYVALGEPAQDALNNSQAFISSFVLDPLLPLATALTPSALMLVSRIRLIYP